ncbi:uncharacterized protein LOC112455816 [Temnothorax curvispinosus]|uniref:Uncharacterized protein LOC112455816 n=1 Tax=Temnothorax curvispinosus TaxID=300111 RepID=A0A6J1PV70_9HYME|nr:uncharacterized protein LOC112455816 [Temnothorax curvispinosus]
MLLLYRMYFFIRYFKGRQSINCPNCHCRNTESVLKRNGNFFVYIPIKEQLRQLLSNSVFHKLQRTCNDNNLLSDVTSRKVYRSMVENQVISDFDITLQWNTDGVNTFKSSKVSMCPILIAINELSYRVRKDNILLAGLWCGSIKPVVDIFLKLFVDELRDLHKHGIDCLPPNLNEAVNIKVHAILSPVDSIARCSLQNIAQFNGKFECSLCLHLGQHVKVGNGYARVYCGNEGIARTREQHHRDAEQAVVKNISINGVKGVSLLMLLTTFNIVVSFPPEYMHAVLLGVVKYFFFMWFDPKYNQCTWYIGSKKSIFNDRLLNICPPCELTRTPRALENMKLYKASEWKNLLLYYSLPCLQGLLPIRLVMNKLRPWAPPTTKSLDPQFLDKVVQTLFPPEEVGWEQEFRTEENGADK